MSQFNRSGDRKHEALLIAHNFPPTQGPESLLVGLNARSLTDFGWEVTALTTTHGHARQGADAGLLKVLPPQMEILRAPSLDATLCSMFPRIGRRLMFWLERNWLPEPYFLWRGPALRTGQRWMAGRPNAVIYSRAPKFVSNVVGLGLKRATGAPWVAHFSDPWADLRRRGGERVKKMEFALERQIIHEADAVVFVSDQTIDLVMRKYPDEWRKKVRVIPHGYDGKALPSTLPALPQSGPLKAIHAGAFYPTFREPFPMFDALALLHRENSLLGRFELMCVGPDTPHYAEEVKKRGLEGVVHLRDTVPFSECQQMILGSHLLVVLDTPGDRGVYLPTKLIEYMAYERPILGITERGSAVATTLERCGQKHGDLKDPASCARVFSDLISDWERGEWRLAESSLEQMRGYEIQRVNQALDTLLREVNQARAKGQSS